MENVRAFSLIRDLGDIAKELHHIPEDIMAGEASTEAIKKEGLTLYIKTDLSYEEINEFLMQTIFLKELVLSKLDDNDAFIEPPKKKRLQILQHPNRT
ncbi:MAG: hypothetical protein ACM3TR_10610 [Caulobacteraceae bacterium]